MSEFSRPKRLEGTSDKVALMYPNGEKVSFYITLNCQDGEPVEVFIASGKAGEETHADCEAMGRLVSVALQHGVSADTIVKTLSNIGGSMTGTYLEERVTSKGELIARALQAA